MSIYRTEDCTPRRTSDCRGGVPRNVATRCEGGWSVSAPHEGTGHTLTIDCADRLDRPSEDSSAVDVKAGRPAHPDWRDPSSYAGTWNLTREGWVWEFLRRNRACAKAAHALRWWDTRHGHRLTIQSFTAFWPSEWSP
jgi:hypothetical protein